MRPNVYQYHDYRAFLKDWFHYLNESDSDFSMRKLAEKCEFAVSYLPMVLSGKRRLSEKHLQAMKKHLGLKADELAFLKHMMAFNDAGDRNEKLELLKKMQKFQKYGDENAKELEAYKYLTKWHYVALREMIQLDSFKNDKDWIQEQLNFAVSPKEISDGLEFLLENKFIAIDKKGKLLVKDKILDCFDGIYRLSLGEFYKQIYRLAIDSIDSIPRDERLLLGHTFAVSNDAFEKISTVLNEALEKIRQIELQDTSKKQVYQVSFAAFPLTKKGES